MDPITEAALTLAKTFGVSPLAVAIAIPMVVKGANAVTKAIPDTATGWKKYVRLVTKVIGIYVKDNSGSSQPETRASTGPSDSNNPVMPELLLDGSMKPSPFQRGAAALKEK